jgi:hypothetical protein
MKHEASAAGMAALNNDVQPNALPSHTLQCKHPQKQMVAGHQIIVLGNRFRLFEPTYSMGYVIQPTLFRAESHVPGMSTGSTTFLWEATLTANSPVKI